MVAVANNKRHRIHKVVAESVECWADCSVVATKRLSLQSNLKPTKRPCSFVPCATLPRLTAKSTLKSSRTSSVVWAVTSIKQKKNSCVKNSLLRWTLPVSPTAFLANWRATFTPCRSCRSKSTPTLKQNTYRSWAKLSVLITKRFQRSTKNWALVNSKPCWH